LIVDDMPENLRLLTTILSQLGYEVRPVTDGRQALHASELHPPDLVLLDINLPGMTGYEVCSHLKAHDRLKDVPVIFLTALNELADKVRAFEVGGVDYITKPFQIEEVHARVKTHLSLRQAKLELQRSYEKLEALEKLRDDLVHMVVHDMRSPLSIVLLNLELLQAEIVRVNENASSDLQTAIASVQALRRMANDLLDIRRLEEGKLPVESAEHDLGTVAATVQAALAGLEHGRTIDLEIETPIRVSCDAVLIRRVLPSEPPRGRGRHSRRRGSRRRSQGPAYDDPPGDLARAQGRPAAGWTRHPRVRAVARTRGHRALLRGRPGVRGAVRLQRLQPRRRERSRLRRARRRSHRQAPAAAPARLPSSGRRGQRPRG
jgi:DNA-binding response OmpR family regulator